MFKKVVNEDNSHIYKLVPIKSNPNTVPSKITYYVNEDKGAVVAVMDNCSGDFSTWFHQEFSKTNPEFYIGFDVRHLSKYRIKGTYRGKALCHPDDKFDLKEGMKIARSRMLYSYYRDLLIKNYEWLEEYNKARDSINNIIDHCSSRLDAMEEVLIPLENIEP